MTNEVNLIVGDLVSKKKGYVFTGEVRAVFTNMRGDKRIVVEMLDSRGLLHIFSPDDVQPATYSRKDAIALKLEMMKPILKTDER